MDLNTIWFLAIAAFFTIYFVLEGFDFGVGMSLPLLGGKSAKEADARRSAAVESIGPLWDGNEVWLIVAGGSIFAAFPDWYATLFSGFYLPLLLILLALIVRGVSIEWRHKVDSLSWRRRCDAGIVLGSIVPAFLWGVAMANMVIGVNFTSFGHVSAATEGFIGLLNPRGLLGGLAFVLLFFAHGLFFLGLKCADPLRRRVHQLARGGIAPLAAAVGAAYLLWMQLATGKGWTWLALVGVLAALVVALVAVWNNRDALAFYGTAAAVVGVGVFLFGSLFPYLLPASNDIASLDIYNASANPYTLKIMSWASLLLAPCVIIGQGWSYWQFRKRVTVDH